MQYGICGDPARAAIARESGFDFFEWTVAAFLMPSKSDVQFRDALEAVSAARIPCPVVNCFVPHDLKITGPEADDVKLEDYVGATFERAETAGVEVIVFGSGGARQIPKEFDRDEARYQLVRFCSMLAPIAQRRGITVAVEPLARTDCNVLNTVAECGALVREVNHPALRLLVDAYHFRRNRERYVDIVTHADLLAHTHLATTPKRLAPGSEPCDLEPFFRALTQRGYKGRVSVEARITDPRAELPEALSRMRVWADAGAEGGAGQEKML